jgi:uncharacterized pyridoxamine 5'-phosphate oxidase family protein
VVDRRPLAVIIGRDIMNQRLIKVYDRHLYNYLGQRNIWPIEDWDEFPVFYLDTKELRTAMENYRI